jgi:hypothetical protein
MEILNVLVRPKTIAISGIAASGRTVYPRLNLKERRSAPLNRFRRNSKGDELTGFHQFRALPKGMKWRIVLKYGLFQIIGVTLLLLVLTVLRQWVNLSPLFFWGFVSLWVIKDIILFAFVWRAYESKDRRMFTL